MSDKVYPHVLVIIKFYSCPLFSAAFGNTYVI